jgi:hypothetical protein
MLRLSHRLRSSAAIALVLVAALAARPATAQQAVRPAPGLIVQNAFVTVREAEWSHDEPLPTGDRHDVAVVFLEGRPTGEVAFARRGALLEAPDDDGRAIVIELEDRPMTHYPKPRDVPVAFPRPGSKKVLENDRVVVWDYTFQPNVPSPLHFHDTDVVVVFLGDGTLASTVPDGTVTRKDHTNGLTSFNPGNRLHTETLVRGTCRVIVVELK